jgi:hypothetical protein
MYILWKDDGQQFHKYNKKNNHLLSQLTENKTKQLEIQVLAWDMHKNVVGF